MNLFSQFLAYLFICRHERVTWPQHRRQTCLDCGQTRRIVLQRGELGVWAYGRWQSSGVSQTLNSIVSREEERAI